MTQEQNISHMEVNCTILKSDTMDSNGRVYSKEAIEKAIEDYKKNYKTMAKDNLSAQK